MTVSESAAPVRELDDQELRDVMSLFATGVAVVTATAPEGDLHGMTANALTSVSLDPPLILVCFSNESKTFDAVRRSGAFGLTMLAHHQQGLALHFARRGDERDWEAAAHELGASARAPIFHEGLASVECEVYRIDEGGDHQIVIGRVLAVSHHQRHEDPLVFFRSRFSRFGGNEAPKP